MLWDIYPGSRSAPSTEDSVFLSPDVVGQYLLATPPAGGPITAGPDSAQKWVTKNSWDWNNDVSSIQNQYDRDFFDGGMVIPASEIPAQPPDLDPDLDLDITGDILRIHWEPYDYIPGGVTANVFFVYKSVISDLGPWERVAVFTDSVTETQVGLTSTCTCFWVEAYDTGRQVGRLRRERLSCWNRGRGLSPAVLH